jgi:hypothetical protein
MTEAFTKLDFAFLAISKARRKAREKLGTGRPGHCYIHCPVCLRGTIFITVESGHFSGECTTSNCVSWSLK